MASRIGQGRWPVQMEFDVLQGFRLGEWEVYPQLNRVVSKDGNQTLEGKVMAVLVEMAKNPDEITSKNTLLDAVWPNQAVAEGVLTRAIHELRHALGDHAQEPVFIENVPRVGYRLLHEIEPLLTAPDVSRTRWRRLSLAALMVVLSFTAILSWQYQGRGAVASPIASVAVLPFVNFTGDAGKDYISDGLAEEVIHLIAQQPQISVAARTSSFALRDSGLSAEEIGERLGVDSIFEGSIREERGVQRITVQLINVRSGRHDGSVTLDVVDGDLFDARGRIGDTVVDMLAKAGAPVNYDVSTAVPATEARAYELYLRGRAALQTRSVDSLQNAKNYFIEALRYDENFAPAHAGLAQLYVVSRVYLQLSYESSQSLAGDASNIALRLDPNNVDALVAAAAVAANRGDFESSIGNFQRALVLQPSNAQAHQWYGEAQEMLGYVLAGHTSITTALQLDPLSGSTNSVMAKAASLAMDNDTLLLTARQADGMGARIASRLLSLYEFRKGDVDAFARELGRYHAVIGVKSSASRLLSDAMAGSISKADLLVGLEPLGVPMDNYFARELALLGMHTEAMAAMSKRAIAEGSFTSDLWLPEFQPVRALPGFVDFADTLGFASYWRNHELPDVCHGSSPESFCSNIGAESSF